MNIKRAFAIFLVYLPLKVFSQWAFPYMTGQGAGYSLGDNHDSFDGYLIGDSLYTFGFQGIGIFPNTGFEYYQDSYNKTDGLFGHSKLIYQWSGVPTTSRKVQDNHRYSNGYIVNEWSSSLEDSIRYIRNLNGSFLRVDHGLKTLIPTTQIEDTTNSFLCETPDHNILLTDWYTGDTIQIFNIDSLASDYQGALNPRAWAMPEYHNDGEFIYLRVAESMLIFSYGYDVLKLSISNGRLVDYQNFTQLSPNFSISQKFSIVVEDSISDQNGQYTSYKSIYNRDWNKLRTISFVADKFYGSPTGSSPIYFSDSVIIFSTLISDSRIIPNNQVIGSHLRVYDNIRGKWIGNSRFQGARGGHNFEIRKILAVRGGYIYLATQTETGSSDRDLLVCLPLDLKYDNPLFQRSLGELEEQSSGLLEIFPNPVSEFLNLNYGSTFDEIRFYDQAGRLIGASPYSEFRRYSTEFLTPGIYYLSIIAGESTIERKMFLKIDQ
jgi:hypothetical protein